MNPHLKVLSVAAVILESVVVDDLNDGHDHGAGVLLDPLQQRLHPEKPNIVLYTELRCE